MTKKKILAILLVVLMTLLLFSCDLFSASVDNAGSVTVVVENTDGSYDVFEAALDAVENKEEGAKGILEHLKESNDRFYLEMTESTYGAYVTAIGNIRESSSEGLYVMVYTSVSSDSYEGAPTADYKGTTLYQSGVGLSGMKVEAGTVILFKLEKSPY